MCAQERLAIHPVGVDEVLRCVRRWHPRFPLPAEPIFAFMGEARGQTAWVLVSEADAPCRQVACAWHGHLGLDTHALKALHGATLQEAKLCGVYSGYSATFVNAAGIWTFGVVKGFRYEYERCLPPGW